MRVADAACIASVRVPAFIKHGACQMGPGVVHGVLASQELSRGNLPGAPNWHVPRPTRHSARIAVEAMILRVSSAPLRRDLLASGLRPLSLRYQLGGQYDLRDHHFGAAEERYGEAHVGDAHKRSVHQLCVAHNVDAAPTGG